MALVHSPRQMEMLRLMGVDVWQTRESNAIPESSPASLKLSEPHVESYQSDQESLGSTHWAAVTIGSDDSGWLFICETDTTGLDAKSPCGRLYDAILSALDFKRPDVNTVMTSSQGRTIGIREATSLENILEQLFAQSTPKVAIILGEQCARALLKTEKPLATLRSEKYRYQGTECLLKVSYGLDWLLNHPEDKAGLWQDLVAARGLITHINQ